MTSQTLVLRRSGTGRVVTGGAVRRVALLCVMGLLVLQGGVSLALRLATGNPDVVHPLLHLLSGAAGLALAGSSSRLFRYAAVFGLAYLLLGLAGAAGVVHVHWLPLEAVDDAFHVVLGGGVAALGAAGGRRGAATPARVPRWLLVAWGGIAVAVAMLALPAEWEGPQLLPISPGHTLSALDTAALVPLLVGVVALKAGTWRRRGHLAAAARRAPGRSGAGIFVGGLGLGLLFASAFSTFWWWWAIGALLLQAAALGASLAAARGDDQMRLPALARPSATALGRA
jgi:hypothetical protein